MDPALYKKFQELNSLHLFCSFRWILVLFRREFNVEEIQILWDFLFADYYCQDMHLFVALAILEIYRMPIITSITEGDELLKFVNNLAGKIDLDKVLAEAADLYSKFRKLDGISSDKSVQDILSDYNK